jgi:hypothetical protein
MQAMLPKPSHIYQFYYLLARPASTRMWVVFFGKLQVLIYQRYQPIYLIYLYTGDDAKQAHEVTIRKLHCESTNALSGLIIPAQRASYFTCEMPTLLTQHIHQST